MNEIAQIPFRHNAWATMTLIGACRDLSQEQLAATAPGAFGSLADTLRHVVISEGFYRRVLTGEFPDWGWRPGMEPPSLEQLAAWAADNEHFWGRFLAEPIELGRECSNPRPDGAVRAAPASVVLAQVVGHACEHRSQACSIMTALGIQPPDLQVWAYGYAIGLCQDRPAS